MTLDVVRPAADSRSSPFFMSLRDVGLFFKGAHTDNLIRRLTDRDGPRAAFEQLYADLDDPWRSEDLRYRYQNQKYRRIAAALPKDRHFARALDIGCGLGGLSRAIAPHADEVLGLDIAQEAVDRATHLARGVPNLSFGRGDILNLPRSLDGKFDLVLAADTIYYLAAPIEDAVLKAVALRFADLLAPGGLCILANHYFFRGHPESPMTRRIHKAFQWSSGLRMVSSHWHPFYLVAVLEKTPSDRETGAE